MNVRTKRCPKCGSEAVSDHAPSGSEMGHVVHTSMHTKNVVLIGASLVAAGVSLIKSHRFACLKCRHRFFSW